MSNNNTIDNLDTESGLPLISEEQKDVSTATTLDKGPFLAVGSSLPNTGVNDVENQHQENYGAMKDVILIQDIETLSKTQLKNKYPLTYSRWKNAKSRKKMGAIIDPRFHNFTDFLGHMGVVPDKSYTLDRIDNDNHTYSPENCRWADKNTQNSNKGNNIYVSHDGETHTIAQWAALTKQKPNTLYKRKREGWADDEIVTGIREKLDVDPWAITPWPKSSRFQWEVSYQNAECYIDSKSRLEYLVRMSKQYLNKYQHEYDSLSNKGEVIPDKLAIDLAYWTMLYKQSEEARRLQHRRKVFIKRYGKQSPLEAKLFDEVNPAAISFSELANISRSEIAKSISDHKRSSE